MKKQIASSELILNADGSIYHLGLLPEQLCPTVLTVGDPKRVAQVSKHFDSIEAKIEKREFVSHIGRIGNEQVLAISTGIGTDNIDIVLNELDALANIDFTTRMLKERHTALDIIRIGTSGSVRQDLPMDSFLVSDYALGIDGLMLFYEYIYSEDSSWLKQNLQAYLTERKLQWPIASYPSQAHGFLLDKFQGDDWQHGITLTATGFYGPQGRNLRLQSNIGHFFEALDEFSYKGLQITNLEMETSGIYALATMLGHRALGLNVILAERRTGGFSQEPKKAVEKLIEKSLDCLFA